MLKPITCNTVLDMLGVVAPLSYLKVAVPSFIFNVIYLADSPSLPSVPSCPSWPLKTFEKVISCVNVVTPSKLNFTLTLPPLAKLLTEAKLADFKLPSAAIFAVAVLIVSI